MTKAEKRREFLEWRESLEPDEMANMSAKVLGNFLTLEDFGMAENIMLYLDFRGEVRTRNLIVASLNLGKTVLAPRVRGDELEVVPVVDPLRGIEPGKFGVPEPTGEPFTGKVDLVLVPAAVFDRRGYRIGYGGGYYDRFLSGPGNASRKIGLAYSRQVIDDQLPEESHDVPVDLVVTEVGIVRCHRFRE